ncbi:hypothetical protein AAFF_G00255960 [Aldrovandia affinis]|uniref:Kinesin-like protein n=1 Tax=Aldrovandia affinis TaxID=143900 RepID=A0AAD7RCI8_9TELE|nr:hypothetical protein AAFF_G00255960 [Aldrovandia affinis]
MPRMPPTGRLMPPGGVGAGNVFAEGQEHGEEPYCHEVRRAGQVRLFSFHAVLGPETSQEEVFEACRVERLVNMAVQGCSCAVFAFGQTGSGKTYTVTGPHSEVLGGPQEPVSHGLIQRCLAHLLGQVQLRSTDGGGVTLSTSYLEIYNEQVWDLLDPQPRRPLAVRGSRTRGFHVENLSVAEFCSLDEFTKLLEEGLRNRHTSSHRQNERSSRGHAILTVHIRTTVTSADGGVATQGKLSLVDLAGSERGRDTELQEETSNINRSLLSLGKCIAALVDAKGRDRHIPYRDSKLTKLLSDSLGGTGVTLMIACVSPTAACLPETLNTLYYSSRAKRIRARPAANRDQRDKLVHSLQREVQLLSAENLLLRQRLSSLQEARRRELEAKDPGSSRPQSGECMWENSAANSTQTGGSSEPATVQRSEPRRPGSSSSCSEACLLQGPGRETDKLQTPLADASPASLPRPGEAPTALTTSLPSCHYSEPPRLPEPCCPCHWHPLLSCPTHCALQGALPPLWRDRRSNETDPRPVPLRRTKQCMGYTEWFQEAGGSSDQRARPVGPRPLMSQHRVVPSAPPLPISPAPFSSCSEGAGRKAHQRPMRTKYKEGGGLNIWMDTDHINMSDLHVWVKS